MYKDYSQIDFSALQIEVKNILDKVNGVGDDYKKDGWAPLLDPSQAVDEIVDIYLDTFWLDTLKTNDDDPDYLNDLKKGLVAKILNIARGSIKTVKLVHNKQLQQYERIQVNYYTPSPSQDRELNKIITNRKKELPRKILKSEYLNKIDENKFDELSKIIFGKLLKTDDDETARKYLKLWMTSVKIKRFYNYEEKFPRNPIWLAIWSEHHSIGKGFLVHSLRKTFSYLFNGNTKSSTLQDLTKQFKGFASRGTYICHIDEADRIMKGTQNPNTMKNLISEKTVSVEKKGVDNSQDFINTLSYISTTNQSIRNHIVKSMESDRRLAEIHITDACNEFKACSYPPEKMDELCTQLWITCPIDDCKIYTEVREKLLNESKIFSDSEFIERIMKIAQVYHPWRGSLLKDGLTYEIKKVGKINARWDTDVKQAYDNIFSGYDWQTFTEKAINTGFLYLKKNGNGNYLKRINFEAIADETSAFENDLESDSNDDIHIDETGLDFLNIE